MHARNAVIIFLVIAFSVIGGCTGGAPVEAPPPGGTSAITGITAPEEDGYVSLDLAMDTLALYDAEELLSTDGMAIHMVSGTGVDATGNAKRWMLGATRGYEAFILIYEGGEWREYPWGGALPEQAINLTTIVIPSELYRMQAGQIRALLEAEDAGETELLLSGGIYTIEVQGRDRRTSLHLNAVTGDVIPRA
ncbi:MAG: hypothetical protein APR53_01660 [Methanoculleus sp. SDB]|nr:MAG: hypothetical protein APR53_01660 [Methanoculleus sp. SDB]